MAEPSSDKKTNSHKRRQRFVVRHRLDWLAVGFGSGLAPVAPGTFGTLAAIPLYAVLIQLPWLFFLLATLLVCVVGIPICGLAAKRAGVHDHPAIVWDEFAGYLITMAIPGFFYAFSWHYVLPGFILFRLFDILKPFPIRWLDQHVKGGFGIMIDDILAGCFAGLVLLLLLVLLL